MGYILFLVAVILGMIVAVPSFLISFFWLLLRGKFKALGNYLYQIAYTIDQSGNVLCQFVFNKVLIKKDGYQFGVADETVSSALGKNQEKGSLKGIGLALNFILNMLDKNHSIDAIEGDEGPAVV